MEIFCANWFSERMKARKCLNYQVNFERFQLITLDFMQLLIILEPFWFTDVDHFELEKIA